MTTKLGTRPESLPAAILTSHDLAWEMAIELFDQAGSESVRVIEALAAVLANRLRDGIACALHPGLAADRTAPPRRTLASGARRALWRPIDPFLSADSEQRFQVCRRIARRSLGGGLPDPTGGATAFHRLGEHPAWAEGLLPLTELGPFLFYRP